MLSNRSGAVVSSAVKARAALRETDFSVATAPIPSTISGSITDRDNAINKDAHSANAVYSRSCYEPHRSNWSTKLR